MNKDATKSVHSREIKDYAEAIGTALQEVAKSSAGEIDIRTVLIALAERTGHVMALIADDKQRELMFQLVCAEIERATATSSMMMDQLIEQCESLERKTMQ